MINIAKIQYWFYAAWFNILVRYRKTILGPLWLLANPIIFISMIGVLFASINNTSLDVFIPHIAFGIIVWSLLVQIMNSSSSLIIHNKPKIINAGLKLNDLVMVNLSVCLLQFLHVALVGLGVWLIFQWPITSYALLSLLGLILIMINGYWIGVIFGIIGSRFQDLPQIITAVTGALFFITPIIWMPVDDGRGGILGPYLTFNPFYHFLELVRAPLLGNPIEPLSYQIVLLITGIGLSSAYFMYKRFAPRISIWI